MNSYLRRFRFSAEASLQYAESMCDTIEIERGDSEMVKRINKSIRTYVNKWVCTSWLVIIVALAGSASSMAGPWADRAIARRTARSERTDLRNNQKQADATYGAGDRANAIAVIVPENTLRPGVVRRLSRRGISVEELNSFTAAGTPQQVAGGRGTAYPINQNGYQAKIRSDTSTQSALNLKRMDMPSELPVSGMAADTGSPQQATGRGGKESRSVLVNAEEPVSTKLNEGPRFPGMQEESAPQDTPVVTHEPIELLPTPSPAK